MVEVVVDVVVGTTTVVVVDVVVVVVVGTAVVVVAIVVVVVVVSVVVVVVVGAAVVVVVAIVVVVVSVVVVVLMVVEVVVVGSVVVVVLAIVVVVVDSGATVMLPSAILAAIGLGIGRVVSVRSALIKLSVIGPSGAPGATPKLMLKKVAPPATLSPDRLIDPAVILPRLSLILDVKLPRDPPFVTVVAFR